MITLYGITRSRALRCLWMLEELGVPYQRELVAQADVHAPDYLRINPNGHIPTLKDGELVLWESLAINLYLADTYGKGLWPASVADRGRCYQWSIWAMTELEGLLLTAMRHRSSLPEAERDPAAAAKAEESARKPFGVLEAVLASRPYLLGAEFSVADLNVAAVASWTRLGKVELGPFPKAADWLARCIGRPAYKAALKEPRASA